MESFIILQISKVLDQFLRPFFITWVIMNDKFLTYCGGLEIAAFPTVARVVANFNILKKGGKIPL